MRQNLSATARKLRLEFALRARPAARADRLASNILALAGPLGRGMRAATNRRSVRRETDWIARWQIDSEHFFDLMSLYPALQRAFFIHIPKCGGTSIRQQLVTAYRMAPIPVPTAGATRQSIECMTAACGQAYNHASDVREPADLRGDYLRAFAAYMVTVKPRRMFVLGHQRARELQTLYRQGTDLLFSTVRPPADILRSLVKYRVDHTVNSPRRQDSMELLEAMQLDHAAFVDLVNLNPRAATEGILSINPPSPASYLSMDERTDHERVWNGIRECTIYIAHVAEQECMLGKLFGEAPDAPPKNTSDGLDGLADTFSRALRDDWIEPFVEPDSVALYQRLQSSGIIGFWQNGGTLDEYRQLLGAATR